LHDFDIFVRWADFCLPNSPGDRFRQLSSVHTKTVDALIVSMSHIS
jgi:hypothetical protein